MYSIFKLGHVEIVRILAENGADLDIGDQFDRTALHWAAKKGFIECFL